MVIDLSASDGSLGVRRRWTRTRVAPSGAPMRRAQPQAPKAVGAAQNAAAMTSRTSKPSHLKGRRVLELTCGRRAHDIHIQRFQNPRGNNGIQKMCQTSNVRISTDRRGCPHERQKSLRKANRFGLSLYVPCTMSMSVSRRDLEITYFASGSGAKRLRQWA